MLDFRPFWKELAAKKQITTGNVIQRAILLGMHQGEIFDEKVRIAIERLSRAFTPKRKNPVEIESFDIETKRFAKRQCPYYAIELQRWYLKTDRGLCAKLEMTDDEKVEFDKLVVEVLKPETLGRLGVHYSYIFLFGDLIPEQRCIQLGHAMLKMGMLLTEANAWPAGVTADNLHFCMIKGNDETAKMLNDEAINCVEFKDYDYTFDENGVLVQSSDVSLKAVVTYPMHWSRRPTSFADYELYRFESNGSD